MPVPHVVYIALGSNLGDRRHYLNAAISAIGELPEVDLRKQSSFLETEPVGPGQQNQYLNAAIEITTTFTPHVLLSALLTIESQLGRTRREKWGPRTIDLDILMFDDLILHDEKTLTIPHPHLHERLFVLQPLCEIAPTVIHPVLRNTMSDLLHRLSANPATKYTVGQSDATPGA